MYQDKLLRRIGYKQISDKYPDIYQQQQTLQNEEFIILEEKKFS